MKRFTQSHRAFTLIELLVVIAIIGLLSSVVFASLNSARSKARDARRLADMRQIQIALELYYDTNGVYPIMGWVHSVDSSWNTLQSALAPYMPTLAKDPTNNGIWWNGAYGYSYYASDYGGSGRWYMLVFRTETQNTLTTQDGSRACDGTLFDYGGSTTPGNITLGGSCVR